MRMIGGKRGHRKHVCTYGRWTHNWQQCQCEATDWAATHHSCWRVDLKAMTGGQGGEHMNPTDSEMQALGSESRFLLSVCQVIPRLCRHHVRAVLFVAVGCPFLE